MGSGGSTNSDHSRIEKQLERDRRENARTVKLLLLGTGECGKSTVLKQMRILHSGGFAQSEYQIQKSIIHENVMTGMVAILNAMTELQIDSASQSFKEDCELVLSVNDVTRNSLGSYEEQFLNSELAGAIKRLWQDAGVQTCFERGSEYQLADSTKYFLDAIDRIGDSNYSPSLDDVLHSRAQTVNIVEVSFEIKEKIFRVFDVGGQRCCRRKWIHCFDNVRAIIFIAAISEYDMTLREDGRTNRLVESLLLFETICNSRWFTKTNVILFLNKKDLFEIKVKEKSIVTAFPDYGGPQTYEGSLAYISGQFDANNKQTGRSIFEHVTCATDTSQMEFVLDSVAEMILSGNLSTLGLIQK